MITFKAFDESDHRAYSGCESDYPMIAEVGDRWIILIDGTTVCVIDSEEDQQQWNWDESEWVAAKDFAHTLGHIYEVMGTDTFLTVVRSSMTSL